MLSGGPSGRCCQLLAGSTRWAVTAPGSVTRCAFGCGCRKLCRWWSGGISVLVDETVTAGRFQDLEVSVWLVCRVGGDGWLLVE